MMESYYDMSQKEDFNRLFGGLWLGAHPTENRNRYMVLKLDFSKVGGKTNDELERAFETHVGNQLSLFARKYHDTFGDGFADRMEALPVVSRFEQIVGLSRQLGVPLYLIIDEYDNFTNQMNRATGVEDYRDITHGAGFYRNWFKKFKGDFDRIFMTGVSPVTMDDLTS